MVVPGQGGDKVPEKINIKEQPPENMLREAQEPIVGLPTSMQDAGGIEKHGFAASNDVLAAATKPSADEVFNRNMSVDAQTNLKTAQQLLKTDGVVPTLAPQVEEAVKNIQTILAKCGKTMGDQTMANLAAKK